MLRAGCLIVFCLLLQHINCQEEQKSEVSQKSGVKKPRLFYVYTLKTTSTKYSANTCFVSTTSLATCGKRKKRSIVETGTELEAEIAPSSINDKESDDMDLLGSQDDDIQKEKERQGKVLLYWLTTTSISTKVSYTATFTVGSIACTPIGWEYAACGK